MSQAEEPTQSHSVQVRALVNRQVQAWEKHDFAIAADDWLPNGESFSPGGHVVKKDMHSAILDYFKKFTGLKVRVNEMGVRGLYVSVASRLCLLFSPKRWATRQE
jgi:hypothetical protein